MSKLNDEQLRVLTLILREPLDESNSSDDAVTLRQNSADASVSYSEQLAGA